jgi:hypothetical protein
VAAAGAHRDDDTGDHGEGDQHDGGATGPAAGQEERDRDQRSELPDGPDRDHRCPERRAQLAGVAEHRHDRAQRGAGERDADEHAGREAVGQQGSHADGHGEGEQPADHGSVERPAAQAGEVDLGPGQEEEQGQSELGEGRGEVVGYDPAEQGRPEHDAQDDLEHDDRDPDEPAEATGQ